MADNNGHSQGAATKGSSDAKDAESAYILADVAEDNANRPSPAGQGWSTGLFDCADDVPNLFDTLLCTPCLLSAQFNKLFNDQSTVSWPLCLSVAVADVLLTKGIMLTAEAMVVRYQIRSRYNIGLSSEHANWDSSRDFFREALSVIFCTPCVTCQNHREMALHGEWPGKVLFGEDPALAAVEHPTEVNIV